MNNNESTPLISIIVPVYNVESYLRRCLDSIQSQTFSDFEVILVDDGSTDNSGNICDAYVRTDHRFTVIHQSNTGVSAARNTGLNVARGKYINFVDADDEVLPNCLELLLANAADDVGLVSGSYIKYTNNVLVPGIKLSKSRRYSRNQFIRKMSNNIKERNAVRTLWSKLFDSSIIKSNRLQFDSKVTYGEDSVFLYDYMFHCDKSVACIPEHVYVYYRRSDGLAMSQLYKYSSKGKNVFFAREKILEMAVANDQPLVTMLLIKNELAKSYWGLRRLMEKTGDEEIKAESKELHEHLVLHLSPLELLLTYLNELRRRICKKL